MEYIYIPQAAYVIFISCSRQQLKWEVVVVGSILSGQYL